jgi:hypothetical protein
MSVSLPLDFPHQCMDGSYQYDCSNNGGDITNDMIQRGSGAATADTAENTSDMIFCNDGTVEYPIAGGVNCSSHGGIKHETGALFKEETGEKGLTNTQKWGIVIGGTALLWYILYKVNK